jgi:hypothetical protein
MKKSSPRSELAPDQVDLRSTDILFLFSKAGRRDAGRSYERASDPLQFRYTAGDELQAEPRAAAGEDHGPVLDERAGFAKSTSFLSPSDPIESSPERSRRGRLLFFLTERLRSASIDTTLASVSDHFRLRRRSRRPAANPARLPKLRPREYAHHAAISARPKPTASMKDLLSRGLLR